MPDFQIGLYWKARLEELTLFVQNVYNTLKFLQSFNELFNSWYGLAMSKKKALERGISIDITFLMKLIEKNTSCTVILIYRFLRGTGMMTIREPHYLSLHRHRHFFPAASYLIFLKFLYILMALQKAI